MLLVDSGNFSDNPSPAGESRTRSLLAGMHKLGYSVVNVGERDIRLGWERFQQRIEGSQLEFISANIVDKGSKERIFDASTVVEIHSPNRLKKLRVGLIGAVRYNPIFSKGGPDGAPMAIVHPKVAIATALQELRQREQKLDMVVLLAAMHRDDAMRIVGEVEGIDFVLGSYGGVYTLKKDLVGSTGVIYSGNQGKRVGVARIFTDEAGKVVDYSQRLHLLGRYYPSDPEMFEYVNEAMGAAEATASGAANRGAAELQAASTAKLVATQPYLGSAGCKACHTGAYQQWSETGHAHALRTVESDPKGGDPSCVSCHVTGFQQTGGFVSRERSPALADVGCESCHGAGRAHAASPNAHKTSNSPKNGAVKRQTCLSCHTTEQSPEFDYYRYLSKVVHQP